MKGSQGIEAGSLIAPIVPAVIGLSGEEFDIWTSQKSLYLAPNFIRLAAMLPSG